MLTLQHLTRQSHAGLLLEEVAVTLLPGCLLRLEGASGSGKTLLLEMIAGKQRCAPHSILFDNQETRGNKLFFGDTRYLPEHQTELTLRWTVEKQLRHWTKKGERELLSPAIHFLQLEPWLKTPLREVSAGWRQRVRLARLILQPATLWLLDRPFLYLDESGRSILETLIASRCQQNGIILFSHDGQTRLNPHGVIALPYNVSARS